MISPIGQTSSVITSTTSGDTHTLGYHDLAATPRLPLISASGGGSEAAPAVPKLLPSEPVGIPKAQQAESQAKSFQDGMRMARPARDIPAAGEAAGGAEAGAAEGALGGIARAAAAFLGRAGNASV